MKTLDFGYGKKVIIEDFSSFFNCVNPKIHCVNCFWNMCKLYANYLC